MFLPLRFFHEENEMMKVEEKEKRKSVFLLSNACSYGIMEM